MYTVCATGNDHDIWQANSQTKSCKRFHLSQISIWTRHLTLNRGKKRTILSLSFSSTTYLTMVRLFCLAFANFSTAPAVMNSSAVDQFSSWLLQRYVTAMMEGYRGRDTIVWPMFYVWLKSRMLHCPVAEAHYSTGSQIPTRIDDLDKNLTQVEWSNNMQLCEYQTIFERYYRYFER